jgi:hypothetical protein
MKNVIALLFILLSGPISAQQFVYIPDPAFRAALEDAVPGCISGTNLNTSYPGLNNLTFLDVPNAGISDITGIQYLPNLGSINCSYNQISFIPALPASLVGLYAGHNSLSSWPVLTPGISSLKIDYNQIGNISSIPSSITNLDISGCGLTYIPSLPSNMIALHCNDNLLNSLPQLPNTLQFLDCRNNSLTTLPFLPNSLFNLFASGNGLTCLPNLPTNPSFTSDIGYGISPTATINASGATSICTGGSVTLNANTGTGFTYQWKKYGNIVVGATNASYVTTTGGQFKVVVTNSSGCSAISAPVTVTVNSLPVATISAGGSTSFCTGSSVLLTANSGTGFAYQWRKSNINIAGAIASTYNASTGGSYKVVVTNSNGCSKSSNSITVTILAAPIATITANGPTTFCAGDSVTLTANTGIGYTYQWRKYANAIAGATAINYTAKNPGNYKCVVTNTNGCTKASNLLTVTIPCRMNMHAAFTDNMDKVLRISPNPSDGLFYISVDNEMYENPATIKIVDLSGHELLTTTFNNNNFPLDLRNYPGNVFLLSVILKDQVIEKKLLKFTD